MTKIIHTEKIGTKERGIKIFFKSGKNKDGFEVFGLDFNAYGNDCLIELNDICNLNLYNYDRENELDAQLMQNEVYDRIR